MSQNPSARTRLKREHRKGVYDRAQIAAILDEAVVCHLGFIENGYPVVVPTLHAREGDTLYIHGSSASRAMRALKTGMEVCITVTLIDGLVLARSAFEHSANFRSVMIFGEAQLIASDEEKLIALKAFTEQLVPSRWEDVRKPTAQELKATAVFRLSWKEASAKIRQGPPDDGDSEDALLPVWAGEIPSKQKWMTPIADPKLSPEIDLPKYLAPYKR